MALSASVLASCHTTATCEDIRPAVVEFIRSEPKQSGVTVYLECNAVRWVLESGRDRESAREAVELECDVHGCSRWRLSTVGDKFQLCETETAPHGRPPLLGSRTCWEFSAEWTQSGWRMTNVVVSSRS